MDAIAIEFVTESMMLYVREFYASRMGTLTFLSKEAVANGLTYSEVLVRDKSAEWEEIIFPFDCTPAVPVDGALKIEEIVYNAGDGPKPGEKDLRLLKYGKQEVIQPGSIFRAILWGERLPFLEKGQTFFIGKKRGSCAITSIIKIKDAMPTSVPAGSIFPIQLTPLQITIFSSYEPIVALNRFLIVKIAPIGWDKWLNIGNYSVPII